MAGQKDILIVSNRLPVHRVTTDGEERWETSPGGLVSALKPILQASNSTWLGWTGVDDDATTPFDLDGIRNHPVPLTREDLRDYYEGFSNSTVWPLYHDAIRAPVFQRDWWKVYRQVNERFAQEAARVAPRGGLVWVHDYHLQLVPGMLRTLRPDLRIGFFLHIPFPPQELFAQLPWRRQILEGLLGADVVGFQTGIGAENFVRLCRRFLDVESQDSTMRVGDRRVLAGAFPISIDYDHYNGMAEGAEVREQMRIIRERLGGRRVVLGVDRLDYTKGIDVRLEAFADLLATGRCDPKETVLVQVAVPSREKVEEYQELRSEIEELIGRINGQHGMVGRTPIQYLHRGVPPAELIALYRLADVMAVTPCRDGMNLVAKEYVACRCDERGVLVLSEFAGAAHELKDALLVNPHDIDNVADAIRRGLSMPTDIQEQRMKRLRGVVSRNNVHHWAQSFYKELGS